MLQRSCTISCPRVYNFLVRKANAATEDDFEYSSHTQRKLLDRTVLEKYLEGTTDAVSVKKPARLPMLLTQDEVRRVFAHPRGEKLLVVQRMRPTIFQREVPDLPNVKP